MAYEMTVPYERGKIDLNYEVSQCGFGSNIFSTPAKLEEMG